VRDNIRPLLLEHIRRHPGISFQVLLSAFKIPEGTLRYHLDRLRKDKKIVQEKIKNSRCYFPYLSKRFPQCPGNVRLTREQEILLDMIDENPGITRKEIMQRMRMDRKTLTYNLKRFRALRLIWKVKEDGVEGFEVITRDKLKAEMFRILVRNFADGEIDRESFFLALDELEKD
jgi:predicted transcriptional regulator